MKVSKIVPKPIETKKLRVAAYCRVSTDSDEQQNSFETQKAHYEAWIKIHDDWEFAGLFYDFGVTGTKTEHRDGLQNLLLECRAGIMTYGYEMRNGTVMINHSEAAVIKQIYKNYISGMSFSMSAKKAGLNIPHGSVKRLLLKKCYLGDDFYPAIIDKETYLAAYNRIKENTFAGNKRRKEAVIHTVFEMGIPTYSFENPFEQAEYIYSLIGVK